MKTLSLVWDQARPMTRPKARMSWYWSWSCCSGAGPVQRPLRTRMAWWIYAGGEMESTLSVTAFWRQLEGELAPQPSMHVDDGAVGVVEDGDLDVEVVGALDVGREDDAGGGGVGVGGADVLGECAAVGEDEAGGGDVPDAGGGGDDARRRRRD